VNRVVVERVAAGALRAHLVELARLRIAVFREYPYLYEGSLDYEQHYLSGYVSGEGSCLLVARDAERIVGAATASPLVAHREQVAPPLVAAGFDPAQVYYFGESVLLPEYRGRGLGHTFFDLRETAAREQGFRFAAFCAVQRPSDHPQKPADYVGHDPFWRRRGYQRHPEIVAHFAWRELGAPSETVKPMVFWTRDLEA
jgi:GNAT superfamily N-acetyltransferase